MLTLLRRLMLLIPELRAPLYSMIFYKILETCFIGAPYGILILTLQDLLLGTLSFAGIAYYTLALILCFIAQGFFGYRVLAIVNPLGTVLCESLRIMAGKHIKELPMSYFTKQSAGSLNSLVSGEIMRLSVLPRIAFPQYVSALALPCVLAPFLLNIDWRLALISLLIIPLSLPLLQASRRILRTYLAKRATSLSVASAKILEYIQGIEVVKGFNKTGEQFDSFRESLDAFKRQNIELSRVATPTAMLFHAALDVGFLLILFFSTYFFIGGEITLLTLLTFLILGLRMYEPIKALNTTYEIVQMVDVTLDGLENLFAAKPLPILKANNKANNNSIEFKNVSFAYADREILKDVSFTIPEGRITALVGPSGAGKTTISRLIARFWDVNSGQILIGGQDVRSFSSEELFAKLSLIFQDVYLFKDSIKNNIAFGQDEASMENIKNAAHAANCDDFINKLPSAYDAIIGEGGATLSGGEKQRISIARAILKDAPIILLDEATSSLDPENSFHIQQGIDALSQSKTMLVIAHTFSTIIHADQIIVLDGKGGIEDRGKHEELLKRGGTYKALWEKQQSTQSWQFAHNTQ